MRKTILASLLLATAPLLAQQDFSKVEIKVTKISGTVYMLEGAGGNIGVSSGDDGIVLIDDQYAPLAPKIITALATISNKPIRFIINTHFHGDHTGGNEPLGKSAPIVAHENVRKRMQSGMDLPGRKVPPAPKDALPVLTFNDRTTVHINGEDVRAIHYPHGHTDGDVMIEFVQSNVVHMGDDFFNGHFPFVDIDNGGSVRGLTRNIDSILGRIRDDAKIIPGHGALADKAAVRAYLEMLRGTTAAVEAAIKAGKTVDQMKQEKVLAKWESWSWQFVPTDRWIETLNRELSATK
jgi:cyclase